MNRIFCLRARLVTAACAATLLTGSCSTIRTSRTTHDAQIGEVAVTKYGVDGFYKPAGVVTADATVTVTITDGGKRTVVDGEDFQVDHDHDNWTDRTDSHFYVGNSIPVVTVGGSPVGNLSGMASLGGGVSMFRDDKLYATDTVNYRLIKKARAAGAVAFLDEPNYEWAIQEDSQYDTVFFFFQFMKTKKMVYRVTATAQTATIEYRSATPPPGAAPAPAAAPTEARPAPAPATAAAAPAAAPAAPRAARAEPVVAAPVAAPPPPPPKAEPTVRIETARRNLLDLEGSTVRALKQLVNSEVALDVGSGTPTRGVLASVERAGLVVGGATVPWDTIVAVEQSR